MAPLWTPSPDLEYSCGMARFRYTLNDKMGIDLPDDAALYQWSIDNYAEFWSHIWDFCHIQGQKGKRLVTHDDSMTECRFFPDAQLNYAENLLSGRSDDQIAFHFRGEDKVKRHMTTGEVRTQVSQLQQYLLANGVKEGDRVAAFMPNVPETIIAMLAATSIGAVWSSASPDFGVQGILDRFGQIEPTILIAIDGYYYNGKWVDCREKLEQVLPQLPSLRDTILVSYDAARPQMVLDNTTAWETALAAHEPREIEYKRQAFNHPLFIMFSSGTTGKPKCIIHGTGGTLLQHVKEHRLHCDIRPHDNVFYFTTCGWMMWNWQASALASGAALSLYDGSPFAPDGNVLLDYADDVGITLFGTSAKYIDTLNKQHYKPINTHSLKTVRTITSTGSVLAPESFDYVYEHVKKDVHLASISGGTDIVSCFMLGYPTRPVYRGELQGAGLGLAVDVYNDKGEKAAIGEKGELVCTRPFPCMPIGFWNDPNGEKYRAAYFERFPGIWHHGDYVEKTEHNGFIIHGRSDATLNPGGVRIGTAEIYRQVEQLPEILESVVVGQNWQDDERVILFVILKQGAVLDEALMTTIKQKIRIGASPRHVPSKIIAVSDIPRTKNNKISEIAVRDTICGRKVANTEALANPEILEQFADIAELKTN